MFLTIKLCTELFSIEQVLYIKMDLALNNLQRLICHKTKQTKPITQKSTEFTKSTVFCCWNCAFNYSFSFCHLYIFSTRMQFNEDILYTHTHTHTHIYIYIYMIEICRMLDPTFYWFLSYCQIHDKFVFARYIYIYIYLFAGIYISLPV